MISSNNTFQFDPDLDNAEIATSSLGGGLVSVSAKIISFAINIAATMIMARILTKNDYGLVAMSAALIAVLEIFKEIGLSSAIVQSDKLDHTKVNSLFWINSGLGITMTILIMLAAPVMAWFYDRQELIGITLALTTGLLAASLCVQHWALTRRKLHFKRLAAVESFATLCGAVVGVVMAASDCGYWSIVCAVITPRFVTCIASWAICSWRPTLSAFDLSSARSAVHFGCHVTGYNLLDITLRNISRVLVGKFSGAASLGVFSKSIQIIEMPASLIAIPGSSISVSALSRLQNKPQEFSRLFLAAICAISTTSMLISISFILIPQEIITILLGAKWLEAAEIIRLLAPVGVLMPLNKMLTACYISMGETRRLLKWGVISSAITLSLLMIGIRYGLHGVALAYSLSLLLSLIPNAYIATRGTSITTWDILMEMKPPIIGAILAVTASLFASSFMARFITEQWLLSAFKLLSAFMVYFLVMILHKRQRKMYKHLVNYMISVTSKSQDRI